MEEKGKIKISLKLFTIILIIMSLIIISLIYIIWTKDKVDVSNKYNENIVNQENVEKQEIEDSKTNINHESGKDYDDKENIIEENNNLVNQENVEKQEIEDSKININHESGKDYDDKENIIVENDNLVKTENEKIYTSYTKDFADITEYSGELIYSINGKLFGWEERLFAGCSSWCSVNNYTVNTTASSTLKPHGKYSYASSNTQDVSRENAWVEGVDGNGVGEYIEIEQICLINSSDYKTDIGFKEICIVNGYAATEKNWNENNRIKELKMYFDNKYVATIVLEDTIEQQYIDISHLDLKVQNGESANFKFEISDVYKGTKYDDTCITGLLIEFSGRTGH